MDRATATILQFDYLANGARLRDFTGNDYDQRRFYHDGLGRPVGIASTELTKHR